MSTLMVVSDFNAQPLAQACADLFEAYDCGWEAQAVSLTSRSDAHGVLTDGLWDACMLDGPLQDLVKASADIRAASVKLSGGADLLFRKNDVVIAVNLFGSAAIAHVEHTQRRLGGAHVAVCGTGPRACALVHACAVAGAERIVLIGQTPKQSKSELELFLARYRRIAYEGLDLQPSDPLHRSFKEAYEQPKYLFGSFATSTQALSSADYIFAAGEEPFATDPGVPEAVLGEQILVYHAGCSLAESALAAAARDAGVTVLDGRGTMAFCAAEAVSVLCMGGAGTEEVRSEQGAALLDDMFAVAAKPLGVPC